MSDRARIVRGSETPKPVANLMDRLADVCEGSRLDHVATALLALYSDTLTMGSQDYAQHQRNVAMAIGVLDANARIHFKVNN